MRSLTLMALVCLAGAGRPVAAQIADTTSADSWTIRIFAATGPAIAWLVLMPGYGGDFADFNTQRQSFPVRAADLTGQGIGVALLAPPIGTLFGDDSHLDALERAMALAARRLGVTPDQPWAVGGFSSGGTDALLIAERCARQRCGGRQAPAAVVTVDAPLDFFRIWDRAILALRHRRPGQKLAEATLVKSAIERRLGGPPRLTSARHRAASPLVARQADGGSAAALRAVAVRAYTEPDIHWWMENRQSDYLDLNAVDAAALVLRLRSFGNAGAELITTTGKGYRADGQRHPRSWSIVDWPEFVAWLVPLLNPIARR